MILVNIDMPESCADCIFKKARTTSLGLIWDCMLGKGTVLSPEFMSDNTNYMMTRHPRCPLKLYDVSKEQKD